MTKPRHKSVMPSRDTKNMTMLLDMAVKRASKAGLIENSDANAIMKTQNVADADQFRLY